MANKRKQHNNEAAVLDLPVEKNQQIELTIEDLSHEGNGVGRVEGYTVFVPGALPGERVSVAITKLKKQYGYARLLDIVSASEDRREPPCPIYKRCGGCTLQHFDYQAQLSFKRKLVEDNLRRIGKIEGVTVHPTIGMDNPWRYRNKAQVPIGEEEGGLIGGFYAQRSHEIIDMESCLIQHEKSDFLVNQVKKIASKYGIPAYDEGSHRGVLRHVVTKVGFATGELMIVLITNSDKLPHQQALVEELAREIPDLKSVVQNINTKRTNVIFGDNTRVLWGEEYIYDTIGDVKFAISARSFYQVNPVQTEKLYSKALEYAGLTGQENVVDAYCGIGTISLFLAQKAKKVFGVEIVPDAIEDAKRNAALNGMDNVEFQVGEAEKVIPAWYTLGNRADVMVVDPPRKGCDEALLQTIIDMKPEKVVYVSCNPSTLARDLRILEDGGYRTVEVQPVDMFPHTTHVECVVKLYLK
ncbi:23S rRNA (uracil(1939)-C(5))-methyltransferase RlmD [Aneurinibacillus sp. Ricciae_BoGa-3]|uniref:23S rRNA (uracil(1939)-C(5))-methyltransferase RlmD n=1 Tax=Aneurinibacillus sp. Ricciae_BoGa-3 TaxID=3022697 RepID=UPI0023402B6C|nr:23S rRNA (uracil(1939)-C(5))-methyltransferase RlmD [Aneurinibacillus sp. Ricciae_BoGa-3]WCK55116.1 23S rRNA (uracil(1939)-C(5))-methyltransferase RlmD [Aneurinibacillus sp. Ricciae_BoGa-3]